LASIVKPMRLLYLCYRIWVHVVLENSILILSFGNSEVSANGEYYGFEFRSSVVLLAYWVSVEGINVACCHISVIVEARAFSVSVES
jgi:hypothetical protein